MSARRTEMHRLQELVRLHRMGGLPVHEVARLLGMSPNTERNYRKILKNAGLLEGESSKLPGLAELRTAVEKALPKSRPPQETSDAAPWEDDIAKMVEKGAAPKAIFDTLKRQKRNELTASEWSVKRLARQLRREAGIRATEVVIPLKILPGQEAQVDFGYVGSLFDPVRGRKAKAWVFVMTLSFSRHQFARIVFEQSTETWIRLHCEALEFFGGVPELIKPDNLKAAVLRAAFDVRTVPGLNRSYRELAQHYNFKIEPTPAYQPNKKGRVERGVSYVKENFFKPQDGDFEDIDDANAQLRAWVQETAGQRLHGTTGRKPLEHFHEEELGCLMSLPAQRFRAVVWKHATVHRDCQVIFERRPYVVPWRLVGKEVWLRAFDRTLEIYADDQRVITHERGVDVPDAIMDRCLPPERAEYRHREPSWWEQRGDAIAPEVGAYVREVLASDDVLSLVPQVQSIVLLLEKHPVARAVAACRRASFYGNHTYIGVRDILRKGLDHEPLPTAVSPALGVVEAPRYARTMAELMNMPVESDDEHH